MSTDKMGAGSPEREPIQLSPLDRLKTQLASAKEYHEDLLRARETSNDSELRVNVDKAYSRILEIKGEIAKLENQESK